MTRSTPTTAMAMGVAMLKKTARASTSSGSTPGSHAHREAAQGQLGGQRGAVRGVELLLWGEGGQIKIGPRLGG